MSATPSTAEQITSGTSPIPQTYSTIEEEYEALTGVVGLLDRSDVGRLSVSGEDALDLLNRLSTNELMELEAGKGVGTVLISSKGRILDLLYVFKHDDRLLVLTSPDGCQKVIDWIDFYMIMEDVVVRDVTTETAMLSLVGPNATSLLGDLAGPGVPSLAPFDFHRVSLAGAEAEVHRTDFLKLPSYDIIVAAAERNRLWGRILETGSGMGVKPVGSQAFEAVRIERGVSAFGAELSEDYNPLEANLMDLISFTKGCYVGQEVIARLNTYKKVQKQLVGLRWSAGVEPLTGSKLTLEGKTVGVVTSVSARRSLGGGIGLGYVKRAQAAPGTTMDTQVEGSTTTIEIIDLPR